MGYPRRYDLNNEEIKELYLSGLSTTQIAKKFNTNCLTIWHRLKKCGVLLRKDFRGKRNGNWKGGRHLNHSGYIDILNPDHTEKSKTYYILEHIWVWQKVHNKKLPDGYIVHHLNGIKTDNRPENLIAMKRNSHSPLSIVEPYKRKIRELEARIAQYKTNLQPSLFKNG